VLLLPPLLCRCRCCCCCCCCCRSCCAVAAVVAVAAAAVAAVASAARCRPRRHSRRRGCRCPRRRCRGPHCSPHRPRRPLCHPPCCSRCRRPCCCRPRCPHEPGVSVSNIVSICIVIMLLTLKARVIHLNLNNWLVLIYRNTTYFVFFEVDGSERV
jgi:hypothetical protein